MALKGVAPPLISSEASLNIPTSQSQIGGNPGDFLPTTNVKEKLFFPQKVKLDHISLEKL